MYHRHFAKKYKGPKYMNNLELSRKKNNYMPKNRVPQNKINHISWKLANLFLIKRIKPITTNSARKLQSRLKNHWCKMPFEIKVMILEFLDSISQINLISSCQENLKLVKFCTIDFGVTTFPGIEQSPYFEAFTFIYVVTKITKIPKNVKILFFGINYTGKELQIIDNLVNLTCLKLVTDDYIDLLNFNLPSLTSLNVSFSKELDIIIRNFLYDVFCKKCNIRESHLCKIKYLYVDHIFLPLSMVKHMNIIKNDDLCENGKNIHYYQEIREMNIPLTHKFLNKIFSDDKKMYYERKQKSIEDAMRRLVKIISND